MEIQFIFVEVVPEKLEPQTLYISIKYKTAIHLCCCGCGGEVVTPLDPAEWKLIYDGESVSLSPSIGNWSTTCQSHYWITNNFVRWSYAFTPEQIELNRNIDRSSKLKRYEIKENKFEQPDTSFVDSMSSNKENTVWRKLKSLFQWR